MPEFPKLTAGENALAEVENRFRAGDLANVRGRYYQGFGVKEHL